MPPRISTLRVAELEVEVTRKSIRSIRIVVEPPDGRVRVSAPHRVGDDALRAAVIERLDWIAKHRKRMAAMDRAPRLELVEGDRLPFLGRDLELRIEAGWKRTRAVLDLANGAVLLKTWEDSGREERAKALDRCWREALLAILPEMARGTEALFGVKVATWTVKRMTSRWGSCNTKERRVCLNLELARRPLACLEYVVVHELAHLIEPGHGPRFKALLAKALPDWKAREKLLSSRALPRD